MELASAAVQELWQRRIKITHAALARALSPEQAQLRRGRPRAARRLGEHGPARIFAQGQEEWRREWELWRAQDYSQDLGHGKGS